MGMGLKKTLLSIFLDYTIDGERVKTVKEYGTTEDGRKYLMKKTKVIPETGEVLEEAYYHPDSRIPYAECINRVVMLN